MTNGGDDNDQLIRELEAEASAEEQHAFVIGEGDMNADALANPTGEPIPGEFAPADFGALPEGGLDLGALPMPGSEGLQFSHEALPGGESPDAGVGPLDFGGMPAEGDFSAAPVEAATDFAAPADGAAEGLGDANLDALGDVDDLLAAAVVGEGTDALLAESLLPSLGSEQPSFQLRLEIADPALKPKLKELATQAGIELTDSAWNAAVPVLSKLTEYQAVAFQRAARALGAGVKSTVKFPLPQPSEEDLALGELAAIPDPAAISSEGAPSVTLPGREKDVLLFTGDELPGFLLQETRGPVLTHRSITRRLFRDEEAAAKMKRELDRVSGRSAAPADSHLQLLFREIFVDLQKQALSRGANAVFALRVESFPETESLDASSQQLRLLVIGTAAVVEKA